MVGGADEHWASEGEYPNDEQGHVACTARLVTTAGLQTGGGDGRARDPHPDEVLNAITTCGQGPHRNDGYENNSGSAEARRSDARREHDWTLEHENGDNEERMAASKTVTGRSGRM